MTADAPTAVAERNARSSAVPTTSGRKVPTWVKVAGWRTLIIVVVLGAWQFLPQIPFFSENFKVFNSFFVSSPVAIAELVWNMTFGIDGTPTYWPFLWITLQATFLGVVIGVGAGALLGLVLSNAPFASRVVQPFLTMLNATPRIAFIPIFIILVGPSLASSVLICVVVVFFIAFYNALTGGKSVSGQSLQNAELMGANTFEVVRSIRFPYVLVWTFAALPNAISFGLISVVTAEVLTGVSGMGRLLSLSIQTVDATLTFAVVVILTLVGLVIFTGTDRLQQRLLHWWHNS